MKYTPLSVKICFLLWKFQLKIFKISEKIPKTRIFFQNFQTHKEAATDIKGAAAFLLANYKIFIFFKNVQSSGVYNIKHNLATSSFLFWLSKLAPRVTKLKTRSRQIMFYTKIALMFEYSYR